MFRQIVSNLPFQPTLIDYINAYIKQLNKEYKLRKIALVMIMIALILNLSLVAISNQKSYGYKSDLVYGASNQKDIIDAYRRNKDILDRNDIRQIYNHYGIAENQLINSKVVNFASNNDNYTLISRSPTLYNSSYVDIIGVEDGGLYEIALNSWSNSLLPNQYKALTGLTSYGFRYWILYDYGGYIVIDTTSNKPNIELYTKFNSSNESQYSDSLTQTIYYRNNGTKWADNLTIEQQLPDGIEYASYYSSQDLILNTDNNKLKWTLNNPNGQMSSGDNWHSIVLNTKVKTQAKDSICFNSKIYANKLIYKDFSTACISLNPTKCKPTTNISNNCSFDNSNAENILFDSYDISKTTNFDTQNDNIIKKISVNNLTNNFNDANNTTVSPGDLIELNLSITNIGVATINNFAMTGENSFDINDILDYASLVNIGDGGKLNEMNNKISWDMLNLQPNETIVKNLIFKVGTAKSPKTLPYNKMSYDLYIESTYGNSIHLNVKSDIIHKITVMTNKLPNINNKTISIFIIFIFIISAYLLYRSYLLKKEMTIIKNDYSAGGF